MWRWRWRMIGGGRNLEDNDNWKRRRNWRKMTTGREGPLQEEEEEWEEAEVEVEDDWRRAVTGAGRYFG